MLQAIVSEADTAAEPARKRNQENACIIHSDIVNYITIDHQA
jgi:hypothetical protein